MSNSANHPYHLVDYSPWPLTGSIGTFTLVAGAVKWFHQHSIILIILGGLIVILTIYQWWRDISREGTFQGLHTSFVVNGLKWGIVLFIVSEVLFFVSFFWGFFHIRLSPNIELGMRWPPFGVTPFNPFHIPLLNTIILLSSGLSITWSHHSLLEGNYYQCKLGLIFTILLGIYFTFLQAYEYNEASFNISDSVYGATFFIATGFHGVHVLVGTAFLIVTFIRHLIFSFSCTHHFGFEASSWYWHFVDVVWLFLYISIYWWGN